MFVEETSPSQRNINESPQTNRADKSEPDIAILYQNKYNILEESNRENYL